MKIVWMLLAIVLVLTAGLGSFLGYMGFFSKPRVLEKDSDPYYFVFRESPDSEFSSVGKITTEINFVLATKGITGKPMQIFYPPETRTNPKVGFSLEEEDFQKFKDLNLQKEIIPSSPSLIVSFPWKNSLSFLIAYMPVERALTEYRAGKALKKGLVIVLNNGNEILYTQPVVK